MCVCVKGVSSTWNDSRVVGVAVVPESAADSASGDLHIAHLHKDILVVTERVGPSQLDTTFSYERLVLTGKVLLQAVCSLIDSMHL